MNVDYLKEKIKEYRQGYWASLALMIFGVAMAAVGGFTTFNNLTALTLVFSGAFILIIGGAIMSVHFSMKASQLTEKLKKFGEKAEIKQVREKAEKESISVIYCRYCGTKNFEDAIYCQKCGKKI